MSKDILSARRKAYLINTDPLKYGTFAEIGAGQEVARHFFKAGSASGTIAKSISAYDMTFSDEIYGKETSGRYVCESRLDKMLNYEYDLLENRLSEQRPDTEFFAFADTVATNRKHGWMGVKYKKLGSSSTNKVILHVRMKDQTREQQHESLGVLGVNLLYAVFFHSQNRDQFIEGLTDNLSRGQIEVDMIRFEGEDLENLDNRLVALDLVKKGLSPAVIFGANGEMEQLSDVLFNKSVFVMRGEYRPFTKVNEEILKAGLDQFDKDFKLKASERVCFLEMTMAHFDSSNPEAYQKDYLSRVDMLAKLGYRVLISNFNEYYRLKVFLRERSQSPIAMVFGANQLEYFFSEDRHKNLAMGVFGACARMFETESKIYVYPYKTDNSCANTKSYFPPTKLSGLYKFLIDNEKIKDLTECDDVEPRRLSSEIRRMIKENEPGWEKDVPDEIIDIVKKTY